MKNKKLIESYIKELEALKQPLDTTQNKSEFDKGVYCAISYINNGVDERISDIREFLEEEDDYTIYECIDYLETFISDLQEECEIKSEDTEYNNGFKQASAPAIEKASKLLDYIMNNHE